MLPYKEFFVVFFSYDARPGGNNRSEDSSVQGNYDYFTQSKCDLKRAFMRRLRWSKQLIEESCLISCKCLIGNGGLERLISSHVEVSKIGRQIAEEVLDLQRRGEDSSSGSSPGPATETGLLNTEVCLNLAGPN